MNKVWDLVRATTGLFLLGLLVVGLIAASAALIQSRSGASGAATQSFPPSQAYPAPQQTASPQSYPGPQRTPQASPPPVSGTSFPTPVVVVLQPPSSPSPWLTFTPPVQPTRRPGPSETPLVVIKPAPSAAGFILYAMGTKSDDWGEVSGLAIYSQSVDPAGQSVGEATSLTGNVQLSGELVYPAPDGRRVAFVAGVESGELVSILNVGTRSVQPLFKTISVGSGRFFGWHPDGQRVLFGAAESGPDSGLWLVDVDTEQLTVLVKDPDASAIHNGAVSPDGQSVIYSFWRGGGVAELRMINTDGTNPHVLFTSKSDMLLLSWSPDGSKIAFLRDAGYAMANADGTNLRPLPVQNLAVDHNFAPTWSPDGNTIAYIAYDGPNPQTQKGMNTNNTPAPFLGTDIHLIDVATGKDNRLVPDGKTGNIDPTWSPDGSQIAFASVRGGASQIWIVNVDGTNLRQLTSFTNFVRHPAWLRTN